MLPHMNAHVKGAKRNPTKTQGAGTSQGGAGQERRHPRRREDTHLKEILTDMEQN